MLLGLDSVGKVSLFVVYIVLWTNQAILVHLSIKWGLQYNVTVAVFLQDVCKLAVTCALYRLQEQGSLAQMLASIRSHKSLFVLYFVPASLYALYNNLTFYALSRFDPASYFVLMQFKIVVTAALSIVFLNKKVETMQWAGLVVIMLGSMLKESSVFKGEHASAVLTGRTLTDYLVILVQLLLSAFAGVYTEKLLKGRTDASPNIQNVFMYVDGMVVNLTVILARTLFTDSADSPATQSSLLTFLHPLILAIILNASFTGVVTGFFLKYLGSILKTIAAALELWTTAILSWLIFDYKVDASAAVAIALVSAGVWLYSEGAKSVPLPYVPVDTDPHPTLSPGRADSGSDLEMKAR